MCLASPREYVYTSNTGDRLLHWSKFSESMSLILSCVRFQISCHRQQLSVLWPQFGNTILKSCPYSWQPFWHTPHIKIAFRLPRLKDKHNHYDWFLLWLEQFYLITVHLDKVNERERIFSLLLPLQLSSFTIYSQIMKKALRSDCNKNNVI